MKVKSKETLREFEEKSTVSMSVMPASENEPKILLLLALRVSKVGKLVISGHSKQKLLFEMSSAKI
jgi:hypothetical protein